jgi:hypothetical protein
VAAATLLVELGAPHRALLHRTCQQILNVLQVSEPKLVRAVDTVAGTNTTHTYCQCAEAAQHYQGRGVIL